MDDGARTCGLPDEWTKHPRGAAVGTPDDIDVWIGLDIGKAEHFADALDAAGESLFAGAVVHPGADDVERELALMEDKPRLGAAFFQTQAVYDPGAFESFMSSAGRCGVPVLAGVIVLKSARMARFLNDRLPGVHVPQPLIDEMEAAADSTAAGVEIAARLIRDLRGMCQGVHVMAIGWEARIPAILAEAGLSPPSQPSPIQEEGALERAWIEGGGL